MDNISNADRREISFEAPKTSPLTPPKFLHDMMKMIIPMITTIPKVSKPIIPPIINTNTTVIIVDIVTLVRFFISIVKGELRPDQAEVPIDACITITYLDITSATIMA